MSMLPDMEYLQACKHIIEQKLDWGDSAGWQTVDFEKLQQRILDNTGVLLSASTLRRIWGRVKYDHLPSTTTLNALAHFAGFENWRNFIKLHNNKDTPTVPAGKVAAKKSPVKKRTWISIALLGVILLVTALLSLFAIKRSRENTNTGLYSFSSEPLTRAVPNSVVFTYDATAAPTDSVYIQQSWDHRKTAWVDKSLHKHTSVYYEPGFYRAKLIVGEQVVKEHPLLIPTQDWLASIDNKMVPVYLKPSQFMYDSVMRIPVSVIQDNNIPLQPQPSYVKYFNVGNFDPVPLSGFSFSGQVKNEYADGAAACQYSEIVLITDEMPIIIQLSVKGCASELTLMNVDRIVSGKNADLSAFGVDFTEWVNVSCENRDNNIMYYVKGKLAYTLPLPSKEVHIVGIAFGFQGTGAVKNIHLDHKGKTVFEAFTGE